MQTERAQKMGCLLIGGEVEQKFLLKMKDVLEREGVYTRCVGQSEKLLASAQEALYVLRQHCVEVCVVALGMLWPVALALAVQLSVERVALIAPADCNAAIAKSTERQIERLKSYVRRNLTFCVAEVLAIEADNTEYRINDIYKGLCNARVQGIILNNVNSKLWTNCEIFNFEPVLQFVRGFECVNGLAKSSEMCIIY